MFSPLFPPSQRSDETYILRHYNTTINRLNHHMAATECFLNRLNLHMLWDMAEGPSNTAVSGISCKNPTGTVAFHYRSMPMSERAILPWPESAAIALGFYYYLLRTCKFAPDGHNFICFAVLKKRGLRNQMFMNRSDYQTCPSSNLLSINQLINFQKLTLIS